MKRVQQIIFYLRALFAVGKLVIILLTFSSLILNKVLTLLANQTNNQVNNKKQKQPRERLT